MNFDGTLEVVHFDPYYQLSPIEREAVDIHEGVHVQQLQPYANRGVWGAVSARFNYALDRPSFEIPAYQAEYNFLHSYPKSTIAPFMRDIVDFAAYRARNNLQYYCDLAGGKNSSC